MRPAIVIACLVIQSLLPGCGGGRPPGPPVRLKSFVLHDIQGLHGGHALWAGEDRTAIIQIVGPPSAGQSGLSEKRYRTKLTPEQWAEVERLVGAHHFLTLQVPERAGTPDEAHPSIAVITTAGTTAKARKWASDKHPDFDPVYRYLLDLCRAEGGLVRQGVFDWDWCPEGFERPW